MNRLMQFSGVCVRSLETGLGFWGKGIVLCGLDYFHESGCYKASLSLVLSLLHTLTYHSHIHFCHESRHQKLCKCQCCALESTELCVT
jgi:hypothetical protein